MASLERFEAIFLNAQKDSPHFPLFGVKGHENGYLEGLNLKPLDAIQAMYSLELVLFLYARGWQLLTDWMFLLDLFVIACGYIEMFLQYFYQGLALQTISISRALRLVRILRLTRLLRRTRGFRELQKLVRTWDRLPGALNPKPWSTD